MEAISKVSKFVIKCSEPINVKHKYHVEDREKEFIGLPKEWSEKLISSGISEREFSENRNAVIRALDFEDRQEDRTKEQFDNNIPETLQIPPRDELISPVDPTVKYLIECKIGQGAFGEVYIGKDRETEQRVNNNSFVLKELIIWIYISQFTFTFSISFLRIRQN